MYEHHFGFSAKPFALTPDPAFLYPSRQHAMALSMLEYALESHAAFALLTGDIGSGKTTLVRKFLRQIDNRVAIGLVTNTHVRFRSVYGWALSALNASPPSGDSDVAQYEALVDFFVREYAKGRRTLLIFDEAQNFSVEVLEELRLLSNVNSEKDLVLQILLVGQPELRDKLLRPELMQFAQRVSIDFHLRPLDPHEAQAYIRHRLSVAGGEPSMFASGAIALIQARTGGVPRLLNQLCDLALVYAYADRRQSVDAALIEEVLQDREGGVALRAFERRAVPAGITNGGAA
jgi:type II secretory pathway predicted ATPase ExeA